jgi:hypothetical protein
MFAQVLTDGAFVNVQGLGEFGIRETVEMFNNEGRFSVGKMICRLLLFHLFSKDCCLIEIVRTDYSIM